MQTVIDFLDKHPGLFVALGGVATTLGVVVGWIVAWYRTANRTTQRRILLIASVSIALVLSTVLILVWPQRGELGEKGGPAAKDAKPDEAPAQEKIDTNQATLGLDLGQGVKIKLIRIEAGLFQMGSPKKEKRDKNELQHEVQISQPFYMGAYLVTQGQYRQVTGANPSHFKNGDDFPVECVTWHDAMEFCSKASEIVKPRSNGWAFDLPTEAEWEYACRAGTKTPYYFGNSISTDQANFKATATTKVGSFPPNPWGLYDMHGNLNQWCRDWLGEDYYSSSRRVDPQGPENGTRRVVRTSNYNEIFAEHLRSARRHGVPPGEVHGVIGFRVVFLPENNQFRPTRSIR